MGWCGSGTFRAQEAVCLDCREEKVGGSAGDKAVEVWGPQGRQWAGPDQGVCVFFPVGSREPQVLFPSPLLSLGEGVRVG